MLGKGALWGYERECGGFGLVGTGLGRLPRGRDDGPGTSVTEADRNG